MRFNTNFQKTLKINRAPEISQRGATLIEALISILIMSIGLLGIAGIQLNAIAFQKTSWSMHRVAEITQDFAERVRSNPAGANNGSYTYTANYATGKAATFTSNSCRASTSFCSVNQIAADDVSAIVLKAQQLLPQGSLQINGTPATGYILSVMYFDKDFVDPSNGTLSASATCTNTTSGIEWRNCCPAAASVPNGVRCKRFNIIP